MCLHDSRMTVTRITHAHVSMTCQSTRTTPRFHQGLKGTNTPPALALIYSFSPDLDTVSPLPPLPPRSHSQGLPSSSNTPTDNLAPSAGQLVDPSSSIAILMRHHSFYTVSARLAIIARRFLKLFRHAALGQTRTMPDSNSKQSANLIVEPCSRNIHHPTDTNKLSTKEEILLTEVHKHQDSSPPERQPPQTVLPHHTTPG